FPTRRSSDLDGGGEGTRGVADAPDRGFRGETLPASSREAAGCFEVLDGAAPFAAERPSGCVRNTKYRVGSFEWQTRIEQGTDWTIERSLPRIARTFFLERREIAIGAPLRFFCKCCI